MATLLHPNGFLQHDLPNGSRMHIWCPRLPKAQITYTPIHDHTYTFESRVAWGILQHREYAVYPVEVGAHVPSLWIPHEVHEGDGNGQLAPTGQSVAVIESESTWFGTNAVYEFGGPGKFHTSEQIYESDDDMTITIMRKLETGLGDKPKVLVPWGQAPDNNFRRDQYPEYVLMPFVKIALELLEMRGA